MEVVMMVMMMMKTDGDVEQKSYLKVCIYCCSCKNVHTHACRKVYIVHK